MKMLPPPVLGGGFLCKKADPKVSFFIYKFFAKVNKNVTVTALFPPAVDEGFIKNKHFKRRR